MGPTSFHFGETVTRKRERVKVRRGACVSSGKVVSSEGEKRRPEE